MTPIPFDPQEITVVSEVSATPKMPSLKHYSYPVTPKEAFKRMLDNDAVWQTIGFETEPFMPYCVPCNIARAMVRETRRFDPDTEGGGPDMFGLVWEYVPVALGSMIKQGAPVLKDMNDWKEVVVWPNINDWAWEESTEANKDFFRDDIFYTYTLTTGWYERIMAFMDFEGAVVALIDDEQKPAIHEFFERLTSLYIELADKVLDTFPAIEGFEVHDDWGSQQNTFFAPSVAAEMIVPYMKRFTDHLHSKGKYCLMHSCGKNDKQIQNYIDAGWDLWNPQDMNDIATLYEHYGDKIVLGTIPELFSPETPDDEQRAAAQKYVAQYCILGKASYVNKYGRTSLFPAFWEELYKQSRIAYSGEM